MPNASLSLSRSSVVVTVIFILCMILSAGSVNLFAAEKPAVTPGEAEWEWTGWGGGGYFWSCAADPSDPQTIYLGGDVNGVCKSTDQGKSWRFINRGLSDYEVNSMVIDPHNSSTVYAFTAGGICKSTDGGENWRLLPMTDRKKMKIISKRGTTVRGIAVDASGSNRIYAGSSVGQLFRSDDGGENWKELSLPEAKQVEAFSGKYCMLLPMKAGSGSWDRFGRIEKIYASSPQDWSKFSTLDAAIYAPKDAPKLEAQLVIQSGKKWLWQQGKFIELKPGEWATVTLDLSKLKETQSIKAFYVIVRSTEAAFNGELRLDAVTVKSADGKESKVVADWEKPGSSAGWKAHYKDAKYKLISGVSHSSGQGKTPIISMTADPKTPGKVYAAIASKGVMVSTDAGENWKLITSLPKSASSVSISVSNPQVLYAAMGPAGVFKSVDGGNTWEKSSLSMPAKSSAVDVAVSRNNPDTVYCIMRQGWNGVVCSSHDGGKTWKKLKRFTPDYVANPTLPKGRNEVSRVTNVTICDPDGQVAFISANWANLITRDGGNTLQETAVGADISCIHDLRFHNGKVYATAMDEGLLMSADNGKSWKQLSPMKYDPNLSGHSWRVNVNGKPGQERILATVSPWNSKLPNKLIRSDDGGKTFQVITSGLPDYRSHANCMWGMSYARALAIDPKNPQIMYLGMDGKKEAKRSGGGIFKSVDGGENWQQLPVQPTSRRAFYGLVVDPTDSNRIYWGTCSGNGGVHMSEDGGASWKRVFNKDLWIFNLLVTADGTVYAAGKNLWRSNDHGKTWKQASRFPDDGRTIVGMAYDPQHPDTLWISRVTWSTGAQGGVFKTTDGGKNWTEMTNRTAYVKPLILRFNPQTRELWAGGVGIFKIKQ